MSLFEKGDSHFTWVGAAGKVSHAERVGKSGRTVCGLKIGKKWVRAAGRGHPVYLAKCATCASVVRSETRRRR